MCLKWTEKINSLNYSASKCVYRQTGQQLFLTSDKGTCLKIVAHNYCGFGHQQNRSLFEDTFYQFHVSIYSCFHLHIRPKNFFCCFRKPDWLLPHHASCPDHLSTNITKYVKVKWKQKARKRRMWEYTISQRNLVPLSGEKKNPTYRPYFWTFFRKQQINF